jgi:hypothetical protein
LNKKVTRKKSAAMSELYYKHVTIIIYNHSDNGLHYKQVKSIIYTSSSITLALAFTNIKAANKTAHISHLCRKTTALRCHRCLINTGVEKMNNI